MSHWYTEATRALAEAELDWPLADVRVALLKTGTTADTERDVTTLAGFTTLDEVADASYSRKALATESVDKDNANDRTEFKSATPVEWTGLTTGGDVAGALFYLHLGADAANVPLFWQDSGGYPFALVNDTFRIHMNAEGWAQARAA